MKANLKEKLEKIDREHYSLLLEIGKVTHEEKLRAYLVGGMVRDLLLGFDNLDIDIVVESNALQLAEALTKKFTNCELSAKHDRFHTAKLIFNLNGKKVPVDLASTRQETYEYPAALPTVVVSDLQKDLIRRDFTINALAVSLLPNDFGEVVDLFNGLEDLKSKKIKILHDKSFIDDPTRIIRAVRFATKLNFKIEEYTEALLKRTIESGQFDNLIETIRGDRVKIETRYLFNLPKIKDALDIFFKSGAYRMVSTSLCHCFAPIGARNDVSNQWLIYLALTMKNLQNQEQEKIMNNLQLAGDEVKIISSGFAVSNRLNTLIENNKPIDAVVIYRELKDLMPESIAIIKSLQINNGQSNLLVDEYLTKTSKIKLEISGKDLISMGIKEGKRIGEILEKVLEKKIKNPSMKREDEIEEVKSSLIL